MFDARLADPSAAAAFGVKAPPEGGVVRYKCVASLVFFVGVVAGEWCFAAVVGAVKETPASASAEFLSVLKLLGDVLVRKRYDYWWGGGVAEDPQ